MKDPAVFCCLPLPEPVEAQFRAAFRLIMAAPGNEFDQLARMHAAGERFDAIVTGLGCSLLDAAAIRALPPSLRMIASYSVGTDHIDLDAARERGLAVSNTPGTLINAVADAAMFLILGAARRATESIDLIRSRAWTGWSPHQLLGVELAGRTLGIYGMGEIGSAVARRARAFGMHIAYTNRLLVETSDACFVPDPLDLMARADILLLAAPSTPHTRGFVNAVSLARAKPSMLLVNIARGDLVVDADLIAALDSGRIQGAALDVFAGEPDIAPGYFDLPNLLMTPHIGSSTLEARMAMGASVIGSIRAFRAGKADSCRLV